MTRNTRPNRHFQRQGTHAVGFCCSHGSTGCHDIEDNFVCIAMGVNLKLTQGGIVMSSTEQGEQSVQRTSIIFATSTSTPTTDDTCNAILSHTASTPRSSCTNEDCRGSCLDTPHTT